MYSNIKRVGCFLLVLVLCFCFMANPIVQPKAEAVAGAVVVGAGALSIIVYLLGALGITAGSQGKIHQIAEGIAGEIARDEPTVFSWLNRQAIDSATGKAIWVPDTTGINIQSTVAKLVLKVMQIVGKNKALTGKATVDIIDNSWGTFFGYKYYSDMENMSEIPFNRGLYDNISFVHRGVSYRYYIAYDSSFQRLFIQRDNATPYEIGVIAFGSGLYNNISTKMGLMYRTINGALYVTAR